MWVMDAKYMANCHKIVIASTKRDLRFYDIAGNQTIEDYDLYGLNNVPHCLAYHYNEKVVSHIVTMTSLLHSGPHVTYRLLKTNSVVFSYGWWSSMLGSGFKSWQGIFLIDL